MANSEPGIRLAKLINKAIDDLELSNSEYEEILALANEDGVIDEQERALLKQLQDMLTNGTIKRVPG